MAQTLPKELPKAIVATHLPEFLKAYANLSTGYDGSEPSSWIQWKNDAEEGDVGSYIAEPCHASMCTTGPGWTDLITNVHVDDEPALTYLRMLIHGPFKGMSDRIYLLQEDKKHFLYCSGLDHWPANVIYNFCIASRVPIEHYGILPKFMKLLEKGYDPTLAALLSWWSHHGHTLGHYWHDAASDWTLIMDGVFKEPSVSFTENPYACRPTNKIWGHDKLMARFVGKNDEEIADMFEMPPYIPPKIEPPKMGKKIPGFAQYMAQMQVNAGIQPAPAWGAHAQPAGGILWPAEEPQWVPPAAAQPIEFDNIQLGNGLEQPNVQQEDNEIDHEDHFFEPEDVDDF